MAYQQHADAAAAQQQADPSTAHYQHHWLTQGGFTTQQENAQTIQDGISVISEGMSGMLPTSVSDSLL